MSAERATPAATGPAGDDSGVVAGAVPVVASASGDGSAAQTAASAEGDDSAAQTAAWLARNAVDSLPDGALAHRLAAGRPLRVKLGIDPTAPDIHLGHTVVLRKLREFQDLGHLVVLIVGDYTARVGDPSGRSETRPMLSPEQIDANAQTFQEQAFKVLDSERVEVRRNSEWLDMRMEELFRLARTTTVAQILERDDFAKRYGGGVPISLLELLYPLLQGFDSVEIEADVELGGTDQKFNLLLARDIQRAYGVAEQAILTMPILPGTDGERRMSKSLGNYIGVAEPPSEIYGKTLSIPDSTVPVYYELLLGGGVPPDLPPRDAKRSLARALVTEFAGAEAAESAEREFDRVHREGGVPDELEEVVWDTAELGDTVHIPELVRRAFGVSTSEARRAIGQGGVSLDGEAVAPDGLDAPAGTLDGKVLKLGKRRFARVRVA